MPTKPEADPRHDVDFADALLASLDMTEEEYAVNQRLGNRFVAAMREREIPVIDTTAVLNRKAGPFYWKKDYHLAVSGCRLVAEQLLTGIQPLLER